MKKCYHENDEDACKKCKELADWYQSPEAFGTESASGITEEYNGYEILTEGYDRIFRNPIGKEKPVEQWDNKNREWRRV